MLADWVDMDGAARLISVYKVSMVWILASRDAQHNAFVRAETKAGASVDDMS